MSETFPKPFGRYELVKRLATGGMAELYVADCLGAHNFRKRVVIKQLLPHMAADPHFRSMFIDEARLTARLVHPKIAQTHELGEIDGQLYICMEHIEGIDVLSMLRECAHRGLKLPFELSVHVLCEVLDALEFAHNLADENGKSLGIVHRDVSPSNILLSLRGDVKLIDFGIARAIGNEHHTQSGVLKGKYGYMSPEQVVGDAIDSRSDLFSAGIVLAELLMGRRLFAAANELDVLLMVRDAKLHRLDKFGDHIPEDLRTVVESALRKDRNARYPSAVAFRGALSEWMFKNQSRMSARAVADVVQVLHEDVWTRRAGQEATPALGESPEARMIRGVPMEPGSSVDSSPIITVESEEIPISEAFESDSVPIMVDDLLSEGIDVSLDDLEDDSVPAPITGKAQDISVRHPSIAAAINSIAEVEPDAPAEFDQVAKDSEQPEEPPKAPVHIPTAEEIRRAPKPKPPRIENIDDEPDDHGDLAAIPPIRVLYDLWAKRADGLLLVSVGPVRKEIYIKEGTPEFVSSNMARELFGEFLVRENALSTGELAMALAMMPHYGGRLGDTLVGLGLMKPLDVFRMLHRQVRAKLVDVCGWDKGVYAYYADRENPRDALPLDLNVADVLGAGAMELSAAQLVPWGARHGNTRPRAVTNPKLEPSEFGLNANAAAVHESLDGGKSMAQLCAQLGDSDLELRFLRLVFLFTHTDLVTLAS